MSWPKLRCQLKKPHRQLVVDFIWVKKLGHQEVLDVQATGKGYRVRVVTVRGSARAHIRLATLQECDSGKIGSKRFEDAHGRTFMTKSKPRSAWTI
jgi:hypothetical protein